MKIKNIEIKQFRGLPGLSLDNFGSINLLLGNNNCGKTTVLEALFLMIGISNPQLSLSINSFRDLPFADEDDFRYIFHNLDYSNTPEIKADFSEKEHKRTLKIKPLYKETTSSNDTTKVKHEDINSITLNTTESAIRVSGLINEFTIKERHSQTKKYTTSVFLQAGGLLVEQPKDYREKINGVFLRSGINESNSITRLEKIIKSKQQDKIINILNRIDTRIKDVTVFSNGRIFFDLEAINCLVPSNIMGDGIRRFLSLITTIFQTSGGIVLIDEIENGLHYSAHKKLWKSIIVACQEFNVQLFVTTHNIETLKYLKEVAKSDDNKMFQNEIKLFSIRFLESGAFKSYRYDFPEFEHAIEQETEIR